MFQKVELEFDLILVKLGKSIKLVQWQSCLVALHLRFHRQKILSA